MLYNKLKMFIKRLKAISYLGLSNRTFRLFSDKKTSNGDVDDH